jgi:CubicO group peptidase (beta-lactamase class C family)
MDKTQLQKEIAKNVLKKMKARKVTGLSYALVDEKGIILSEGLGYADMVQNVPVTDETLFQIGSITKLFTGLAVMKLAADKGIDLDAPYRKYVPELSMKSHYKNIKLFTLKNLLTHHSGVPSDWYLNTRPIWPGQPLDLERVIKELNQDFLAFPPDYVTSYSNLGYILLGYFIQKVSGISYEEYVKRNILIPLGMNQSTFGLEEIAGTGLSKAYSRHKEVNCYRPPAPAGGLLASVKELGIFIQILLNHGMVRKKEVINPEQLEFMFSAQNQNVLLDAKCKVKTGISCWIIQDRNRGTEILHDGGTTFFFSRLILLPEHKLGVIVLSNSFGARRTVDQAGLFALKRAFELKSNSSTAATQPEDEYSDRREDLEHIKDFAGHYNTMYGLTEVKYNNGKPVMKIGNNPKLRLLVRKSGGFTPQLKLFGLITVNHPQITGLTFYFEKVDGHSLIISNLDNFDSLFGTKLTPYSIPQIWLNRLGDYEIENLANDQFVPILKPSLKKVGNYLVFSVTNEYRVRQSFALTPVSDREAVIFGFGRMMNETLRIVNRSGEDKIIFKGLTLHKPIKHDRISP